MRAAKGSRDPVCIAMDWIAILPHSVVLVLVLVLVRWSLTNRATDMSCSGFR